MNIPTPISRYIRTYLNIIYSFFPEKKNKRVRFCDFSISKFAIDNALDTVIRFKCDACIFVHILVLLFKSIYFMFKQWRNGVADKVRGITVWTARNFLKENVLDKGSFLTFLSFGEWFELVETQFHLPNNIPYLSYVFSIRDWKFVYVIESVIISGM